MNEPYLQKLPPQSVETEEAFLSACLLGQAVEASELLEPDDFYRSAHNKIFSSIVDLVSKKEPVDLNTLVNILRGKNELDEIGGASFIARLIDTVPSPDSIKSYARIIKSHSQKRKLIEICSTTVQECYNGKELSEILGNLDMRTSEITLHSGSFVKLGDVIESMMDHWEDMVKNPKLPGIPTGLTLVDNKFGGYQMGLHVIAGRPGMGKTAYGMRIGRGAAEKGFPVMWASYEMSKEQLLTREVSCQSGVDGERFQTGRLENQHWIKIADAVQAIHGLPIYVDDSPTSTITELQSKIRAFKKRHGRGLVLIDYLDYIRGLKSDRKDLEIGTVTKGLKASAKEHDLPIILFVQLNRECENRPDKRPVIRDLRNSGEIEQDSDTISFLYRHEVYDPNDEETKGKAEFIVRKYRQGRTGTIPLAYIGHRTTFENLAYER
jgi:replicative DNA helicase